jgi:SAM-dependent methyltransferase
MSSAELAEHAGYLSDSTKLEAYEQALGRLLRADEDVVLDLGAGTGVLGLLAARAGARLVYAVDSGAILGPAADVAARSEVADRLIHLRGRSTELALPEPVDVVVCDQIGGFVHDAGVLEFFADARRRLLAPEGRLVPSHFRLLLAPARCRRVREQLDVWASEPAGFDFSVFHRLAVNTEHRVDAGDIELLGPGAVVAEFPSDHLDRIEGRMRATIDIPGGFDGLVGWFEADLGGGVSLTNHPGRADRIRRWCNFYPVASSTSTGPGHEVQARVDLRPRLRTVTWEVSITSADGEVLPTERHSTLLGRFLAPDDLARSAGGAVRSTEVGRAVALALDLADGTRSTDEVMEAVRAALPPETPAPVVDKVRGALERFSEPMDSAR